MAMKFTHVLEPIRINQVEVKNRIFRSGHGTYFGKGRVNDTLVAYHEERAKNGVGLSTSEVTVVHPSSASQPTIWGWDDSVIPGFRDLSTAAHRHGMKMFAQIWHGGHHWPGLDGIAWSASAVPSPWGPVPIAMSEEQIQEMIASFAATSVRAREGGMDGIELHFGHGYLVQQFFSPFTNLRTDRYGGSLENRMRFGREILLAVRKAVGNDYATGIRISDSNAPGGVTIEECAQMVKLFCQEGLIDFVNGSMGSYHSVASMLPAMDTPVGAMLPAARPIVAGANATRNVVRMTAGRFQTLEEADQLIRDDQADMVAIVRAMIADPEVMTKTLAGRAEDVRPCIGCNQGCVGGIMGPMHQMGCTVNPAVGFESTLSESLIRPAATPRKVVVVGGGPAGMEAARVAALCGRHVVLFEAQSDLGGAINIAKRAPHLHPAGDITLWLEREIFRLGVDVRLATYAERDEIIAENPDVVIVATGSVPRTDGLQSDTPGLLTQGIDQPHVHTSHEIFDVPLSTLGKTAVVYDDVGHYEAIGVAEYLVKQGLHVTFITRHPQLAPKMVATSRVEPALVRLQDGGNFDFVPRARIVEIGKNNVQHVPLQGVQLRTVAADTVVFVTNNQSLIDVHDSLRDSAKSRPFTLKLIGDALSPRDIQAAITDGHMAGRFIAA
jgi:2,4-dienoyl-CoA reductase-like NADH-dependent reductase (Old Yellow Enzyme family)